MLLQRELAYRGAALIPLWASYFQQGNQTTIINSINPRVKARAISGYLKVDPKTSPQRLSARPSSVKMSFAFRVNQETAKTSSILPIEK
jgi:hypothetical protein